MKARWTAFLLALSLLFSTAYAQTAYPATVSVTSSSISPGNVVEMSVNLSGNSGLAAWMFDFSWDTDALTLDTSDGSAQVGDAFSSGTLLARQKDDGGLTVSWYSVRNVSVDGELFSIRLKANPSASGSYPVTITCSAENTINTAEQEVSVTCIGGSVTVTGGSETTSSDTHARDNGGGLSAGDVTKPQLGEASPAATEEDQTPAATPPVEFSDVPENAYYYDAVQWAVKNGVTNGVGGSSFCPNGVCSRAQTVTFLWRAAGSPEPTVLSNPFTDVQPGSYYYKAVLWAVAEGITNGTGEDTFSPDATVNRAQTVTFLWRANGSQKAEGASPFSDVAKEAYYTDAVQWAVEHHITGGTGANTFSPGDSCIRVQIVTFLYRNAAGGESK